jgi:hypothetical protein
MIDIEKSISTLVESQFPEFYKEEGPLFILFVKEYYKWLEENYTQLTLANATNFAVNDVVTQGTSRGVVEYKNGNALLVKIVTGYFVVDNTPVTTSGGATSLIESSESTNALYFSRNLTKIKDLDFTTDNFLVYFKEKYLKGVQFDTFSAKRTLIKASQDLYSSKGSERSIDLLFRLVFGEGASVYYPGDDILKPSHGQWVIPKYLEVTVTPKGVLLIGKQVTGSISGATAFCEKLIKRNIKGKIIDVLYLSNVQGVFETGDLIVDDTGLVADAPKVVGSLSSIDITSSGELFEVGEEVLLYSERGIGARALVTEIVTETGLVRFRLIVDGGWGYANTSEIIVSDKVLGVSNVTNSNTLITQFNLFEIVEQPITQLVSNNVTGALQVGNYVTNPDGASGVIVTVTQTAGSNVATIKVNGLSGNLTSNLVYRISNQQWLGVQSNNTSSNTFVVGELVYQSNGSSNVTVGTVDSIANITIATINSTSISANGIHVGMYAYQPHTAASATVLALPWTSYTNYSSVPFVVLGNVDGTFSNTHTIQFRLSSSNATVITSATPLNAANGELLKLSNVSGDRWYEGNTIYGSISGEINSPIVVADIGGVIQSSSNVTAIGNVCGSNTNSVGVIDITNVFYGVPGSRIVGRVSNTTATVLTTSLGQGANAEISQLTDTETVRLTLDFLKDNNSNNVPFLNMLLTGANSSYGKIADVAIISGGTGYDNTNIVTFSGGNTGAGSFGSANASIITNASGTITNIILTANTGNGYSTNPTTTIANSTGGSSGIGTGGSVVPVFSLGFPKLAGGTILTPILDLLRFSTKTIGTISSLWKINPGENYNVKPFITAYEPAVAELDRRDIILDITNMNGPTFTIGETVTQTTNSVAVKLFANLYSGNTALKVDEFVFSTDGIETVAFGEVYSYNLIASNNYQIVIKNQSGTFSNTINTSILVVNNTNDFNIGDAVTQGTANGIVLNTNTTHMVLKSVNGTFAANSTNASSNGGGTTSITSANNNFKSYFVVGDFSNTRFIVANTAADTSSAVAKGYVRTANTTQVKVKRTSLFAEFTPTVANNLIGAFSGSNASIVSVTEDASSNASGINAIIDANVSFNEGAISQVQILDSGFGYENDETITIYSEDFAKSATAKANIDTNGTGTGYYATRDGFLSDAKKIQDGYYYQEYSYQVDSPIPLDKYNVMLKEVLHVAGTVFFGKVVTSTAVNNSIAVVSSDVEIS